MPESAQQVLLAEVERLLEPLQEAVASSERRQRLFAGIGWDLYAITGFPVAELDVALERCQQAVVQLVALADPGPSSLADLEAALDAAGQAFVAIRALSSLLDDVGTPAPPDFDRLGADLVSFLTLRYLQTYRPTAYALLELLTLIEPTQGIQASAPVVDAATGAVVRFPTAGPRLQFDRLGRLLTDPVGLLREQYIGTQGLQTTAQAEAAADKLFPRLAAVLRTFGVSVLYGLKPEYGLDFGPAGNRFAAHMLSLFVPLDLGADLAGSGLELTLALSAADQGNLGLVVFPFGTLAFTRTFSAWQLEASLRGGVGGFSVGPDGVRLPGVAGGSVEVDASALRLARAAGGAQLLGSVSGTRLEVGRLQATAAAAFDATRGEVGFLVEVDSAALVVSAGDGDGFLQQVLPPQGLRTDFDLALGWSNTRGLYFRGAAGLEAKLNVQASLLGVVSVDTVDLAIRTRDTSLEAIAGATATVSLGPVTAVVERMGLTALLAFPPQGGNLGLAHLELVFKPPDGVALEIDAGAVSGSGYLYVDPVRQRYAGVLELEVGARFNVKALALLTTAPNAFSLLALVFVEDFSPIGLGFGFTLNAVGGMLAINRRAAVEVLRAGLKAHALDALLFPADVAENAPRLISDLEQQFPLAVGRFLFGPMVKLGWGAPTILTMDLALLLELPSPARLIILGRLQALLPSEQQAQVELRMDALGVIDFDRGDVALDASLYDSRLVGFSLTGDSALRAGWGAEPSFVLAVGGLHPRFAAPPAFPKLRRVALSLAEGNNPRLRMEAYLALTSNTAQVGALLDLHAEVGGFALDGHLAFDTLFQFEPFLFVAEFGGTLALSYQRSVLLALGVEMALSGPAPWQARGSATLNFLGSQQSIAFELRVGQAAPPPALPPLDRQELHRQLVAALRDVRNWTAQVPADGHGLVSLRRIPTPANSLLAHPLGELGAHQRILPLGLELTRFGSARLAAPSTFDLDLGSVTVNQLPPRLAPLPTEDAFALAQFRDLSDDEKLVRPSFEPFRSGLRFGFDQVAFDGAQTRTLAYDEVVVDPDREARSRQTVTLAAGSLSAQLASGAVATSTLNTSGRAKYQAPERTIPIAEPAFVVASSQNLSRQALDGVLVDGAYTQVLDRLRSHLASHPEDRDRLQVVAAHEPVS